jgi:hypothetical protein
MRNILFCFACLLLLAFSCEKKENKGEEALTKSDKIKSEIDLLRDSMQHSWQLMTISDEQKLKDIKRLLDEVSYTSKYNVVLHDSLLNFYQQLLLKRYNDVTMQYPDKIDAYDRATDSLLKATFRHVASTPEIERHPLAQTLIDDIMEADNNLVVYRARYDRWVKEYNNYLEKHMTKLKKLGPPYDSLVKKPMFTIN